MKPGRGSDGNALTRNVFLRSSGETGSRRKMSPGGRNGCENDPLKNDEAPLNLGGSQKFGKGTQRADRPPRTSRARNFGKK